MKIALITCQRLPQGVAEDAPLWDALNHQKIDFDLCIWNEPRDWSQYDLCLLRSVWDYHEQSDKFMKWVNETSLVTQVINPPKVIEWNRNKRYLKELSENHIPIAPTVWLDKNKPNNLNNVLKSLPISQQYFLKPVVGADSVGTHRFNMSSLEAAQKHLDLWTKNHDMMLQSYLPSVETYGEVSVIYFGGQFSHAIRKIPVKGDYRVQDTFGATDIRHHLKTPERAAADRVNNFLTEKFGALCYARIDLLIDPNDQPVINELELIEPSLFFAHENASPNNLIKVVQ